MAAPPLAASAADILGRMLRRLPASLWDTDPTATTLQRDLYQAFAAPMAVWLEQRTIARTMTLLREAQGVDLDVLLADYGLRRYLQRPDATARQVGLQILWTPRATTYAVRRVADLLFDLPHMTLDTGVNQTHVFVADTHPTTTPHTYWGMVSQDGRWYSVTIDHGFPVVSTFPPPGVNTAPPGSALAWFTVRDEHQVSWYVVIEGGTLAMTETQPTWGTGTAEPFRVRDGAGGLWELRADATLPVLTTVIATGLEPYGFWRLRSTDTALLYALYVTGNVVEISTTMPPGRDETPTTDALDWLTLWEPNGTPWYGFIAGGTVELTRMMPAGTGTNIVYRVLDEHSVWWEMGVETGSAVVALRQLTASSVGDAVPLLDPGHPFETVALANEAGVSWWLSIRDRVPQLSDTLPAGATDVTPPGGPYRWLRLYDLVGTLWYGFPTTSFGLWDVSTTNPGGMGTAVVQTLGDDQGIRWHLGIDPADAFAVSDSPRRTFEGLSTAIALTDSQEHTWFWRIEGTLPFLQVSDVLWPDSLLQSPWGQLGWVLVTAETGQPRYVFPEQGTGNPTVAEGPPLGAPWGWSEPVPFSDATGRQWHLEIDSASVLTYASHLLDDIPTPPPVLSLREARDAFAHVQSAGCAVTILLT